MIFEGVKVSGQLLLFRIGFFFSFFQGVQEQGPMLSALKGGANTSSEEKKVQMLRNCASI